MTKFRNKKLADKISAMPAKENLVSANSIPAPNAKNLQGYDAYSLDKWLKLISILNTSKLQDQFYRTENESILTVRSLVHECAMEDPYFVAQCIIYSRCVGEGMRSVNHLAASELAKFISGMDWAKRFYGLWNKKAQKGGTIFRADDILEIISCYSYFNPDKTITNAMKKGFASAIENMDTHILLKYKSKLIDSINLVHPNPDNSVKVQVSVSDWNLYITTLSNKTKNKKLKEKLLDKLIKSESEKENIPVITAIMVGYPLSADTWEVAQSDAGQEVAKAVIENKITKEEAAIVLTEAKAENWAGLLKDNKLAILAAIRNIRNILLNNPNSETINLLCDLLSDKNKILQGKIMPYQLDIANEVLKREFNDSNSRNISKALLKGYESALPNLSELLIGNNLVLIDMSGSMTMSSGIVLQANTRNQYNSNSLDKAALIGSTIAKATNADIIRFGGHAEYVSYNPNQDVFSLANSIKRGMGTTSLSAAWSLAKSSGKKYDRVFILSDNECNEGNTYTAYKSYVESVGNPYVYSVDLAAYGTNAIAGPKVRYYYGYGFSMFEDIANVEFNPNQHIDKIKKIVI